MYGKDKNTEKEAGNGHFVTFTSPLKLAIDPIECLNDQLWGFKKQFT